MKFIGLLFGFLFLFQTSMSNEIQNRKKDSLLANTYFDLAWKYRSRNADSSFFYANQSLKIAEKYNFIQLKYYCLGRIGEYYRNIEQYPKANVYLLRSQKARIKSNDSNDIFNGFINLGNLFLYQEKYDSAIYYFNEGLKFGKQDRFPSHQAKSLNGLSIAYMNTKEYDLAEISLNKALSIGIQQNDSLGIANRYQNLGVFYEKIERYELSFKNFNLANTVYEKLNNDEGIVDIQINISAILIHLRKYKESIVRLEEADKISLERGFLKKRVTILNNLGLAYQALGELDMASEQYNIGFNLAMKNSRSKSIVELGINQAYLLKEQMKYEELIVKLTSLESLIIDQNLHQFLFHVYLLRADALAGIGRYEEAFQNRLSFFEQQDSLAQEIDQAQILAAEIEQAKSEQALLQERNQRQEIEILKQKAENTAQNYGIWALSLLLVAAIIIFSLRVRNAKVKAKALEDKKRSEEELMAVTQKVDIQILEKQIEARAQQSVKIGQDLHDNLGSKLAVVQMLYDGISSKLNISDEGIQARMNKLGTLIDQSCGDMRSVAHDLMDADLKSNGLLKELEQYYTVLNELKDIHFDFDTVSYIEKRLPEKVEKEILAVIRLLTENIIRHANALNVKIRIAEEANHLHIELNDDGGGFDVEQALQNGGKGLKNAQLRAQKIGGEFSVESSKNNGTKAIIIIPFNI